MGKHTDALPSLDDFRAPWETAGGTDAEIDKPKLRRWIYGVLTDKAKAQDTREEVQEKLTAAEAELVTAKEEAADANGDEAQKKIDRLEAKVEKLTDERDKLVSEKELAELREEVLGDFERENPKAAKYVKGETREELEASLEEIKEDFGISDEENEEDEEEEEVENIGRVRPISRLSSGTDRSSKDKGPEVIDFDAVAAQIDARGPFG